MDACKRHAHWALGLQALMMNFDLVARLAQAVPSECAQVPPVLRSVP